MKDDFEIIETYGKDRYAGEYIFLRHKKTGLEILSHNFYDEDNQFEHSFSFNFRLPIDDPFLGTAHVLEHMIFSGSEKYNFDLLDARKYTAYSFINAFTDKFFSKYIFRSFLEDEVIKALPIFADFVFFPQLSENALLQECFRVEMEETDGEKKFKNRPCGIAYAEMKKAEKCVLRYGGSPYKMHELTLEKVRDFHKKYYTPENCLLIYEGTSSLDELIEKIDIFIPDLEKKFGKTKKKDDTKIKELFQHQEIFENLDDFFYVYTIARNGPIPVYKNRYPKERSEDEIVSWYLKNINLSEYEKKLDDLHKWQNENHDDEMIEAFSPLAIDYVEISWDDKKTWKNEKKPKPGNSSPFSYALVKNDYFEFGIQIPKVGEKIENACKFYAGWLWFYIQKKLRQKGMLYDADVFCDGNMITIDTSRDADAESSKKNIFEILKDACDYEFTKNDILVCRTHILSLFLIENAKPCHRRDFSDSDINEMQFDVTVEDLHTAATVIFDVVEQSLW